ncbi:MAG: DNA/RNA nuclease SfsA [Candidatus Sericytochromatia bacterium]|nr:DNA/RNA nuclease SfsA [Candidatus Sericytochromatia bacterium]
MNRFVLACSGPEEVLAFLPNTGRLQELLVPGAAIGLLPADRQGKTRWDAQIVQHGTGWVILDNRLTMTLVGQALAAGTLAAWQPYGPWRAEVPCGRHRFDYAALQGEVQAWLEVKAVNLIIDGVARFPGAPSVRATAHLRQLSTLARAGHAAGMIFVIGRDDAVACGPHRPMDPAFADAWLDALATGVRLMAQRCTVSPTGIRLLAEPVPLCVEPGSSDAAQAQQPP